MPGLAAGVVTEAQVNSQPQAPTKLGLALDSAATWSYIWTVAAFLYLVGIYLGMIVIRRKNS